MKTLSQSTQFALEARSRPGSAQFARRALALWRTVANSRPRAYLLFFCLYILPTVILARQKLFWDDEFFTLYLSTTRSWDVLMKALLTGADQHPPSFYWLTHLIVGALGTSSITLRLTAMAGFFAMCCCLYEITSRLLNREWGFCAMILPLACPYYYYAVEARGYGLELGFTGLALLAWMRVSEGGSRRWALPLLAASVCGAVASHYYAVLLLAGLVMGELTRTAVHRRLDWPVWLAFAASGLPVLAFSTVIASAHTYAAHFWAAPHWRAMFSWYLDALGYALVLPVALSALAALRLSIPGFRSFARYRRIEPWNSAVLVTLAIMPVAAVVMAKLVTNAFTNRYAIAAFPGVCILLTIGYSRIIRYRSSAAAALWLCTLLVFAATGLRQAKHQYDEWSDLRETAAFLRQKSAGAPVVMSDLTRFHRLSFYARRDLGARVVFLTDPSRSIEYQDQDTVDRGLLDLNPWFPLNVRWFHEWIAEHPTFLMWAFIGNWSWNPNALADLGARPTVEAVLNDCVLLRATGVSPPPSRRTPGDPSGYPMLYSTTPTDGMPLCRKYMGAGSCPAVD